nr:MAG TPA: hypothetical protein [Caudoviricetes sp.]
MFIAVSYTENKNKHNSKQITAIVVNIYFTVNIRL